jgi:hypothetical protein
MVWTTPTARTTGELITASIWNTDLKDDLLLLKTSIGTDGFPLWTSITKAATYTWTTGDPNLIYVSGTFTLSAPASPTTGKPYLVKKTDSSGLVTVSGNGKTIDGASTFLMGPYDAFTFLYNGTEWNVS